MLVLFLYDGGSHRNRSQSDNASEFRSVNPKFIGFLETDDTGSLNGFLVKHYPKYNDRTSLKALLLEACKQGKMNIAKYLIEERHVSPLLKVYTSGIERQDNTTYETFSLAARSGNTELMRYIAVKCHIGEITPTCLSRPGP